MHFFADRARHAKIWLQSVRDYAWPVFGDLAVADVDTGLIVRALRPFGRRCPRRRNGYGAASKRCSVMRHRLVIAKATARPAGKAALSINSRSHRRCIRLNTYRPAPWRHRRVCADYPGEPRWPCPSVPDLDGGTAGRGCGRTMERD